MFRPTYFTIWERAFLQITIEEARNLTDADSKDVYTTDNFNEVILISNQDEITFFENMKFYFAKEAPFK